MVGVKIVKLPEAVAVALPSVNETDPVVAASGTVTTSCVDVDEITAAITPLNLTLLFSNELASKSAPVIVTDEPATPEVGAKPVIEGLSIVKSVEEYDVVPFTDNEIFPVEAPAGTFTVNEAVVALVTVAAMPLNFTTLFAGVGSKFEPAIVTVVPIGP